jgi:periplasmic divalent cation tolerance protein
MSTTEYVVILVTCGSHEEASSIAEKVITEKLAACVNITSPVTSIYRWEGTLQKEVEWLIMIKTHQSKTTALQNLVKALHSYTIPEFITLPIIEGSESYLNWVRQNIS